MTLKYSNLPTPPVKFSQTPLNTISRSITNYSKFLKGGEWFHLDRGKPIS